MKNSPSHTSGPTRMDTLDLARGVAIALMILSHSVVGLFPFAGLSGWQLVPVHLFTKFSSSLFFTVFGMALAMFFVPQSDTPAYAVRRRRLIFRGIEILVWYKVLTFVQMFQTYDRKWVIEAMLFMRFPDFIEVLGFYGLFLLWFPFVLPLWKKIPTWSQPILAILTFWIGYSLNESFDFWGYDFLKTILVEKKGEFTFGQLQRGALVFFGMWLGTVYLETKEHQKKNYLKLLAGGGLAFLGLFLILSIPEIYKSLTLVASNVGKHPPSVTFMSFSLSGACLILAGSLALKKVPLPLKAFCWLGAKPLQAFVFHIFIIFVLYRYLLDLRHNVSYTEAIWLTVFLIGLTMIWCFLLQVKDRKTSAKGGNI